MATTVKFTSKGSALVTGLLLASNIKYVWWGIGTTTAAATDTDPESEGAENRITGTQSQVTTDHANDTYQVVGELTCAGGAKAITEAGVSDADDAGDAYVRATFSAQNVDVADKIEFTFKVKHDHS